VSKPLASVGLMSGTSLDGIDIAQLTTDGEAHVVRGPCATFAYSTEQRDLLRSAIKAAQDVTVRSDRSGVLGEAERELTRWHAEVVQAFLAQEGISADDIDIIGFHGQTVIHCPETSLTVQLGDGRALAAALGIKVAYDMRAADIAAGGQGAPLVPVYHRALAVQFQQRPVAFVNIGGVANITYVDDDQLLAFDTGPGNALIDDWMRKHTGTARDEGGKTALAGHVDQGTVAQFLGDTYFEKSAPKSLDRNSFASVSLQGLGVADGAATLAAVTVQTIAASVKHLPKMPSLWIVTGGGRKNTAIMQALRDCLPNVKTAEQVGLDGDSMEAEAWGYLAVRCEKQLPITFPGTTGVKEPTMGGIIAAG
jgi:anhydro-N-acetylmuramic acid kinase